MECQQCQGIETTFNDKLALKDLKKYREKGPNKTTHAMINFLKNEGIKEMTLLDIGGGVGVIQHELLKNGMSRAISVDASSSYIYTSKKEAENQGLIDRVTYHHGNFIDLAPNIPITDVVTLDRVICCYPDMDKLVENSVAHARNYYGIVFPKDTLWMKVGMALVNGFQKLRRSNFRGYVHSKKKIYKIIQSNNFERCFNQKAGFWHIEVYRKSKV
ncbi:MAG: methyltransferase domain-containing protein [Candidatus Hermodarchaeota archaeon]